jgi:UDP-GlcNAc:undecaprenyl-phosphate GlcNAc-1-phosphate transferase
VWFYIPVLDCLRLIVLRLWHGRSPFLPDRRHFHYRLAARLGERGAIVVYVGVVGLTSFTATVMPELSFLGLTIGSIVFCGFLLADGLTSSGVSDESAPVDPGNVIALEKKLAKGA